MSDVDRLREAADRLDEWVAEYRRRGGGPLTLVDAWAKEAALLRAVADADRDLTDGVPSCITIPALALADTILGVGNE